jgi:hypothetical protein
VSSSSVVTTKCKSDHYLNIQATHHYLRTVISVLPIPLVARSMALVCGASLAGIGGSNPAEGMDVCVFCECCVSSGRSLSDGTEHSPRKVLPGVVCLDVIW